jgi:hypothetical protein
MKSRYFSARSWLRAVAVVAVLSVLPARAHAQITPEELADLRNTLGNRIEALTILGGDFGLAGGTFRSSGRFSFGQNTNATLGVSKLGGSGDIGDPSPIGNTGVGWQLRVQGNMGWTSAQNNIQTGELAGDVNNVSTYGIEFGGGARLWLSDNFSIAPTIMALYGHASSSYTANSVFMQTHKQEAIDAGLIDWSVNTLTGVAAATFEYDWNWNRTLFAFSVTPTYFDTQTLNASNSNVNVGGSSTTLATMLDIDMPLDKELWGHELRTGGYFRHTDLYGGLKSGLNEDYINELHGRLVWDFLNQFWKAQWIGIGASYLWGPNITGWTFGADVVFRF